MAGEEFETHRRSYEYKPGRVLRIYEQSPAIDKHCTVEAANHLALFFGRLRLLSLFVILGRNYETLAARRASRSFSAVLIRKAYHCIASGTIELDCHS